MFVLGLTGGIASGKSTVSAMLQEMGAAVIDADTLARAVVMPGTTGWREVVAAFGPEVVTTAGALNRPLLAKMIFADEPKRRRLEAIVHPLVHAAMGEELARLRAQPTWPLAVLAVPLLFESGSALPWCHGTAVVWVPEHMQLARLIQRDALAPAEALRRIRAQWPLEQKRLLADYCIDNSGSLAATRDQVQRLWAELTSKS